MATSTIARGKANRAKDLTGQRFGRLAILHLTGERRHGKLVWRCRCDCGIECDVVSRQLIAGDTRSCGCLKQETSLTHGATTGYGKTREYQTWLNMHQRCYNPKAPRFNRYGGRGIAVCERWSDFAAFSADMGAQPPGMSIDRWPNNDGDYEPGNCRWATRTQQQQNMSSNTVLTLNDKSMAMAAWADYLGLPRKLLQSRIRSGWSHERALTQRPQQHRSPVKRSAG